MQANRTAGVVNEHERSTTTTRCLMCGGEGLSTIVDQDLGALCTHCEQYHRGHVEARQDVARQALTRALSDARAWLHEDEIAGICSTLCVEPLPPAAAAR